MPSVFISYSHDPTDPTHAERVAGLAASLLRDGLKVFFDQNRGDEEEGLQWPIWMDDKIQEADYVLLVCTELYWKKVRQKVAEDEGRGVCWEANIIYALLYEKKLNTTKFLPVLFSPADRRFIPTPLGGRDYFVLNLQSGYKELYAFLTGQHRIHFPKQGTALQTVAQKTIEPVFALPGKGAELNISSAPFPPTAISTLKSDSLLHQIPPAPAAFMGRDKEIDKLLVRVEAERPHEGAAAAIEALQGFGGVGKTALALALAARLRGRFPDGQLFLDLNGYSPERSPLKPDDFLAHVVRSFDPVAKLPENPAELRLLYLGVLDGKRVLLLADNIAPQAGIDRLVPPAGSFLLLTSRETLDLAGLDPVRIGALPEADALKLLRRLCSRISEDPDTILSPLAHRSGWLALALETNARTLHTNRLLTIPALCQRLEGERALIQPVDAAFQVSYDNLATDDLRRAWRQLAIFPGDFDVTAAAAVWACAEDAAIDHLGKLESASLLILDEPTNGLRMHDLARMFAGKQLDAACDERTVVMRRHDEHCRRVWAELENKLCNLSSIEARCVAGKIDELIADYNDALVSADLTLSQRERIFEFTRFIRAQSDVLARHPELTFQQALNEPDSTAPARTARDLVDRETRPRFRWVNKPQTPSPCVLTLSGHTDGVNNCDVSPDGKRIVSASFDTELKIWHVSNGRNLLTLRGHSASVETCSFSPDGKSIVSGARNGEIKLWDAVSGNELRSFPGHRDGVATCKFSLDGRRVVSSSGDTTLKIWNAETGAELHTLRGHASEVYTCVFSPDGKRILSGGGDGSLRLWDAATGEKLDPFDGHMKAVMSCAFSWDGESVFSASEDGTLNRWNTATRELRNTYEGHEEAVWCLAVSKDETRLASGSNDGSIRLWDIATGAELAKMTDHTGQVWGLAFFPDGTRVVSAAWDSTLKVWDLKTAERAQADRKPQQVPVESAKGKVASLGRPISACSCSPDGAYYAAGSADGNVKLWDAATGSIVGIFNLHRDWILACKFSPDARWILSGAWDGSLKLFDVVERREGPVIPRVEKILDCAFSRDGELFVSCSPDRIQVWEKTVAGVLPRCAWREEEEHPFQTCALAPDGNWIIGGFEDGRLVIWDVALETPAGSFAGHSGLRYCDLSPDGTRLVSASSDGSLKIWDVATRSELKHLAAHKVQVDSCNFSPDGKRVVSSSWDHTVKVWDLERPSEKPVTLIGHTNTLQDARFSPDGKRILSAGIDGTVRLWDAKSEAPLGYLLGPADSVIACAFSPDQRRIVSASHRHALKLWDSGNGKMEYILRAHEDAVCACAFSPDSRRLVSASADCTLRLWEVAPGRALATLTGHRGPVISCAFSPDGKQIVSGAWDKTVRLWDAETGAPLTTLPGHEGWVQLVLFSSDGTRIVSCAQDKTLKIWKTAGGELLSTLVGHQDLGSSCAFSSDGSRLVSGSWDGILKVWDVSAGSELLTLTGHAGGIQSCAFSPDGLQIVSASMDKTLKLWDTSSGQLRCTLTGHEGWVLACAFSGDGKHVLSGSEDRLLKMWDSANGREICEYWAGASVQSVSLHPTARRLAAGDAAGQLHLLELEGSV
jgi:WD40 repeat protein